MKLRLTALSLLALLLPAVLVPAPSRAQDALTAGCRANIDPARLSPQKAEECVRQFHDNPALLETLMEDSPEEAREIIAYNSALKDYKKTIVSYKDLDLYAQYERIMTKTACPLCDLGLGPEPELSFDWTEKYLPQNTADFKFSVRTWDALGPVRTQGLQGFGHAKGNWNALPIIERYRTLAGWARFVVAKTTSVPVAAHPDKRELAELVAVLKQDVYDEDIKAELDQYLKKSGVKPAKQKETAASKAAADKVTKTAQGAAALKGLSAGSQAAQLDNFFNGTGHRPAADMDAKKKPGAKYAYSALTPAQINGLGAKMLSQGADGSLSGPLAAEIKGTKAGDEVLAFYKDKGYQKSGTNKLAFAFEPMDKGLFGGWNWGREDIRLNSELVNDWMKKNKVTPEMLLRGDQAASKHLAGLSSYLAPTFVHEATHQRQTAKDKREGIDLFKYNGKTNSYYQMEKETEAFSMDASFTAEKYAKLSKAARQKYVNGLDPFDKKNMETFLKQGVDGVRLSNHKGYSTKESLDGHASKEFVMAKSTSMRLQALQDKAADDPGAFTAGDRSEMSALRGQMDSKFKWYNITMRDSVEAEHKINEWREETRLKLSRKKTISRTPVPTLLSP